MIRLGGTSSPWIAQWLKHLHYTSPFAVMGGLALLSSLICNILPETLGVGTLETLEDAKRY